MDDETLQAESFRDPFGVWAATQRARYPGSAELLPQMMLAEHRLLHKAHQVAAKLKWPCAGLAFQRRPTTTPDTLWRCKHIGCPTCWYSRRCELFGQLEKTASPFFYVKTIESRWDRPIDPQMLKSFKEDWTGMKLLGHMVACDVDADGCEWEPGRQTPMPIYRLVGVFVSDKRIRPRRSTAHSTDTCRFRVEFDNDSKIYAAFEIEYREYGCASEVIEDWLTFDPYPFKIAELDEYADFLTTINIQFSRSGRINTKQIQKCVKVTQTGTELSQLGASVSE